MHIGSAGCSLVLPQMTHQPVIRNPFPQLSRVAVAPFFNHSDEATVDGRRFSLAYFSELQATPGFEVVPLGVVEEAMLAHRIDLNSPGEARRLAKILGVDAVVVGAVTDFSPYYPPRCGLKVEWYTANEGFHEIPTGYGLPWNTPEEEFIPDSLVYESQMSLARAQMATQSPDCDSVSQTLPMPPKSLTSTTDDKMGHGMMGHGEMEHGATGPAESGSTDSDSIDDGKTAQENSLQQTTAEEELPVGNAELLSEAKAMPSESVSEGSVSRTTEPTPAITPGGTVGALPSGWPNESCFLPAPMQADRPACVPYHGPVLSHTQIYLGHDPHLTESLQSYVYFRDDARFGGWQSYLQRSDDFIRFCCHMHISEMLSARGGSRKTRVVWRWPESR